jgi:hypothetical protein
MGECLKEMVTLRFVKASDENIIQAARKGLASPCPSSLSRMKKATSKLIKKKATNKLIKKKATNKEENLTCRGKSLTSLTMPSIVLMALCAQRTRGEGRDMRK